MGINHSWFMRVLLRALVFLGIVWLFSMAILDVESKTVAAGRGSLEHVNELTAVGTYKARPKLDTNYMSKRRVPNGPDPIHNRRAGNSRQPPGQA